MEGETSGSLIPHPLPIKVLSFRALLKEPDPMEQLCLLPAHTLGHHRTQCLLSPSLSPPGAGPGPLSQDLLTKKEKGDSV